MSTPDRPRQSFTMDDEDPIPSERDQLQQWEQPRTIQTMQGHANAGHCILEYQAGTNGERVYIRIKDAGNCDLRVWKITGGLQIMMYGKSGAELSCIREALKGVLRFLDLSSRLEPSDAAALPVAVPDDELDDFRPRKPTQKPESDL